MIVSAAIVDSLDNPTRLLSARRKAPKSFPGRWEFPGGKVEVDESDLDALVREIREELGVEVEVGQEILSPSAEPWPVVNNWSMRVWIVEITSGVPQADREHDLVKWLERDEVLSVPWLDPDVPIVEKLLSEHFTNGK